MIEPAALWSMAQQFGRHGINYVSFAILAVLLTPEDFGLAGVAMIWINFAQIFAEFGFGAALIQRPTIDEAHLSSTFALNIAVGVILTVIGVLGAPYVAFGFGTPEAAGVISLLSLTFLLKSFGLTHAVMAQRNLEFQKLASRDMLATGMGGVVGIWLALDGHGVMSLVWQSIVSSVVGSVLLWRVSHWRPRLLACSFAAVRDLWTYGSQIFYFGIFKFFGQNSDKLLIAYLLGATALGAYTLASRLVLIPTSMLLGSIGAYLFPKLAELQRDESLARSAFLDAMKFTARLATPALIAVAALGPVMVTGIFGEKWSEAAALLPVMALIAACQVWISPVGQVMKSMGHPDWLLRWSIFYTALVLAALYLGAPGGLMGMTLGLAAASVVGLLVNQILLRSMISVTFLDALRIGREPLLLSAAGSAGGVMMWQLIPLDGTYRAGATLLAFGAIYLALTGAVLSGRATGPTSTRP